MVLTRGKKFGSVIVSALGCQHIVGGEGGGKEPHQHRRPGHGTGGSTCPREGEAQGLVQSCFLFGQFADGPFLNICTHTIQGCPKFWHLWTTLEEKQVVLDHTLNTQTLTKTDERKKGFKYIYSFVLGHIRSHPGPRAARRPGVAHPDRASVK